MQQTSEIPDLLAKSQSAFLTLPPTTFLQQAINSLAQAKVSCALILENGELQGILTERDIVKTTISQKQLNELTVAELMSSELFTIKTTEVKDIFAVSRLFSQHRIRHLPVLDEENKLVGVLTPQTIRDHLKPEYLLRYVRAREVISKDVVTGLPQESILAIAQKMTQQRVSCVVIMDEKNAYPSGIITERDIVRFHSLGLDFQQVIAQNVMSCPLSTMQPLDSLWNIHRKMQQMGVRRLVITETTGELAGIVTQTQLLKILDPTEMYHVMQQMQTTIEQQTEQLQQLNQRLKLANQQLAKLAELDELTQVVNRRHLKKFLAQEWIHHQQFAKPLSVIMCDVDHFKAYNDTYGHLAGDRCLAQVAQALREVIRQNSDLVSRYGGEEFLVVLPNTNQQGAECVAKKIINKLNNLRLPHSSSSTSDYVTLSLGLATIVPNGDVSINTLLSMADYCLYQAKQKGRNTYITKVQA